MTAWLQEAIRLGQVSQDPAEAGFPRYVWAYQEDRWFEGRLINAGEGTYKGYPLGDDETPLGLTRRSSR